MYFLNPLGDFHDIIYDNNLSTLSTKPFHRQWKYAIEFVYTFFICKTNENKIKLKSFIRNNGKQRWPAFEKKKVKIHRHATHIISINKN